MKIVALGSELARLLCKSCRLLAVMWLVSNNVCAQPAASPQCFVQDDPKPRDFRLARGATVEGSTSVTHPSGQIIASDFFVLEYAEEWEQARWVSYKGVGAKGLGKVSRSNDFRPDPRVKTGSAALQDYSGSGYDRGHLAPAADMSWSASAMSSSFYLSNISPQEPAFNRGIWRSCESRFRELSSAADEIYVTTGPIFFATPSRTIGKNNVGVPPAFFKVAVWKVSTGSDEKWEGCGVILKNSKEQQDLQNALMPIDEIEAVTQIDFFFELPDAVETACEASVAPTAMRLFSPIRPNGRGDSEAMGLGDSVQCKGTTLKGERCKNKTRDKAGYCHHHVSQADGVESKKVKATRETAVQCAGTTKSGNRCKRKTKNLSGKCYQHE